MFFRRPLLDYASDTVVKEIRSLLIGDEIGCLCINIIASSSRPHVPPRVTPTGAHGDGFNREEALGHETRFALSLGFKLNGSVWPTHADG